jgi:hypothetical protein
MRECDHASDRAYWDALAELRAPRALPVGPALGGWRGDVSQTRPLAPGLWTVSPISEGLRASCESRANSDIPRVYVFDIMGLAGGASAGAGISLWPRRPGLSLQVPTLDLNTFAGWSPNSRRVPRDAHQRGGMGDTLGGLPAAQGNPPRTLRLADHLEGSLAREAGRVAGDLAAFRCFRYASGPQKPKPPSRLPYTSVFDEIGGCTRTRTLDPLIKSQLLYQLSYAPVGCAL